MPTVLEIDKKTLIILLTKSFHQGVELISCFVALLVEINPHKSNHFG